MTRRKRARGAGRKRKPNVVRTPSGAPTRAATARDERKRSDVQMSEHAAMETAIGARRRKYGVPEETAKDQRWATAVGRLRMTDAIDDAGYDAAVSFLGVHGRYLRSIGAPGQPSNAGEGGKPCGECGSMTPCDECAGEWADRCREQRDKAMGCVEALCDKIGSRLPAMAMDMIVLRDIEAAHLVPYLLLALAALAQHFGVKPKAQPRRRRNVGRGPEVATPAAVINPNMLGDVAH